MVAQILCYSSVALSHEFTSSTKTNLERVIFLSLFETWWIHEITSSQKKLKSHYPQKLAPTNSNDSTHLLSNENESSHDIWQWHSSLTPFLCGAVFLKQTSKFHLLIFWPHLLHFSWLNQKIIVGSTTSLNTFIQKTILQEMWFWKWTWKNTQGLKFMSLMYT